MKILFLVRSLYYGGAERQLVLLSKGLCERGHDVVVALFYSGGPLEKELWDTAVRVRPLNKRGRWDVFGFLFRLCQVLKEEQPDLLHGYLFEPNLVTVILKPLFPSMKVAWGLRTSMLDYTRYDWLDRLSFKVNCWLSGFPDVIIANSHEGRNYHLAHGYPPEKMVVIPNGIDTERFCLDAEARRGVRWEWQVNESETLIGVVGRLDPMKDHPVFLHAAALLARKRKNMRFVCVGSGPRAYRIQLENLAKSLGLEECLLWVEAREDMPAVYNALDMAISSSYGEGMSNVIGEAMACGVPCVVTDVGDSAQVVGDQGEVVKSRDSRALQEAMERVLDHKLSTPTRIRRRIVEEFSILNLVTRTESVLNGLFSKSAGRESSPYTVPAVAGTKSAAEGLRLASTTSQSSTAATCDAQKGQSSA